MTRRTPETSDAQRARRPRGSGSAAGVPAGPGRAALRPGECRWLPPRHCSRGGPAAQHGHAASAGGRLAVGADRLWARRPHGLANPGLAVHRRPSCDRPSRPPSLPDRTPAATLADMATERARDFARVGVVGLGTMGAGIVEVLARTGLRCRRRRGRRGRRGARPGLAGAARRPGGRPREARRRGPRRAARPGSVRTSLDDLAAVRARGRGGPRAAGPQAGDLRRLDRIVPARDRSSRPTPPPCRSPRSRWPPADPRRVVGMHFFNPAPVHAARRGDPDRRHRAATSWTTSRPSRAAGQEPRRRRRQGRVHRQRAAVRLPQPRGVDVREPLRVARGHRRGDAAGVRAADGPAGAHGPHRARHRVRDPRHDVPAGPRPAARPGPLIKQMVSAGLLGRKTGRGFYTYEHRARPRWCRTR